MPKATPKKKIRVTHQRPPVVMPACPTNPANPIHYGAQMIMEAINGSDFPIEYVRGLLRRMIEDQTLWDALACARESQYHRDADRQLVAKVLERFVGKPGGKR